MKKIRIFINYYKSEATRIWVRFMIIQNMYLLIASLVDENNICTPKMQNNF